MDIKIVGQTISTRKEYSLVKNSDKTIRIPRNSQAMAPKLDEKKERFKSEPPSELRVTGTISNNVKMSESGEDVKNTSGRKFRIRTNKDLSLIEKRPSFANSMTPQLGGSKIAKDSEDPINVSPNFDNRALKPVNILKELPELRKNKTLLPIQPPLNIQKKPETMKIFYNPSNFEKDKQLITYFFRTKFSSLLSSIGKKDYILTIWKNVQGNKHEMNYKIPYTIDFDAQATYANIREDLIGRLKKIVSTKSKYRYKEKIDFSKSLLLKSLNYDTRKRSQQKPTLMRVSSTHSIEDEDQSDEDEDKKEVDVKKTVGGTTGISSIAMNDINYWKKKNKVDTKTKIFIIVGGYPDLRKALLDRGWQENKDPNSPCFDLKWTTKVKDLDYRNLLDGQLVNHFQNNYCFTTKVGLAKNLKNLIAISGVDIDHFYPRCYDLGDSADFDDFLEEFKFSKVESYLKRFLEKHSRKSLIPKYDQFRCLLALNIVIRKNQDLFSIVGNAANREIYPVISPEEWAVFESDNIQIYESKKKVFDDWHLKLKQVFENEVKGKNEKNMREIVEEEEEHDDKDKNDRHELKVSEKLINKVIELLTALEKRNPQFHLNGPDNIWIVKPGFLSRGRGIKCFGSLDRIMDYIVGKETNFVVQKYIENPLIVRNRKFDIRQWVMITDFNPAKVWFYDECYIRFSAEDYDSKNLNNRYAHLTNNSIAKYSEHFKNSDIVGNMWSQDEFAEHITEISGKNTFYEEIQPQMKKIVICAIESCLELVEPRKNSMELFGFDFMIDENLKPWIIEINSSPAMDYSSVIKIVSLEIISTILLSLIKPVTERLVKMVLEDAIKVGVDYRMQKKGKKPVDTGMFKLIYKGKNL